jgi:hypothetical protein
MEPTNKKITPYIFAFLILILLGIFLIMQNRIQPPVDEPQTVTDDTNTITYTNASTNNIIVELPFPGAVTGKEFSVIGRARGPWFFEASFPIEVLDKDGKRLAISFAQAEGEWMTTEFVRFKGDVKVPESYIGPATLILHKDNPSGLPEHDASISFPFTIEY